MKRYICFKLFFTINSALCTLMMNDIMIAVTETLSLKRQIFANGPSGHPATSSAAHLGSLRRREKRRQMEIAGRILTQARRFRKMWKRKTVTPTSSAQVSIDLTW